MRSVSNFLKGVAIVTVLVNHYLNLNVVGNFSGYSNMFIGIFFFQSGYATYYYLKKNMNTVNHRSILLFLYNRAIRIFPLLWFAWALEFCVRGGDLNLLIPTGIHGEGHYWFIPALFQCYVLAPLIFRGMTTNMHSTLIFCLLAFLSLNLLFTIDALPVFLRSGFNFINSKWRGLYFLHCLLFFMGLVSHFWLPKYQPKIINMTKKTALFFFWLSLVAVLGGMLYLRHLENSSPFFHWGFLIAPILPIVLICLFSFLYEIEDRIFSFMGSISYAIYLFHMSFYLIIGYLGSFPKNSFLELCTVLILMPLFLFACRYIERFGGYIYVRLKRPVFIN